MEKIDWGEDITTACEKIKRNRDEMLKQSPAKLNAFLDDGIQELSVWVESCKHNAWVGDAFEADQSIKEAYGLIYQRVKELYKLFVALRAERRI